MCTGMKKREGGREGGREVIMRECGRKGDEGEEEKKERWRR